MSNKNIYHVEETRKGANQSEFQYGIYGPSSSPHPYESFRSLQEAKDACYRMNKEVSHEQK